MRVIVMEAYGEKAPYTGKRGTMTKEPCPELGGIKNPHIILDDGGDVWGYQCWWVFEEEYAGIGEIGHDG